MFQTGEHFSSLHPVRRLVCAYRRVWQQTLYHASYLCLCLPLPYLPNNRHRPRSIANTSLPKVQDLKTVERKSTEKHIVATSRDLYGRHFALATRRIHRGSRLHLLASSASALSRD
jgi:hypothetical protein